MNYSSRTTAWSFHTENAFVYLNYFRTFFLSNTVYVYTEVDENGNAKEKKELPDTFENRPYPEIFRVKYFFVTMIDKMEILRNEQG